MRHTARGVSSAPRGRCTAWGSAACVGPRPVPWSLRIISGVSRREGSSVAEELEASVSVEEERAGTTAGVSCSSVAPLPMRELAPLPHLCHAR